MIEPFDDQQQQINYQQKLEASSRPLFKAILLLMPPGDKQICHEFEQLIKIRFNKNKVITRRYLNLWAGNFGTIRPLPKWLYSAAIEFLLLKQVNPLQIISPTKIAEHWSRPRRSYLTLEEASQQFVRQFNPAFEQIAEIQQAIIAVYAKPIPPEFV